MTHPLMFAGPTAYLLAGLAVLLIVIRRENGLYANETHFMRNLFYAVVVLTWPVIFVLGVRAAIIEQRRRDAQRALELMHQKLWQDEEQQVRTHLARIMTEVRTSKYPAVLLLLGATLFPAHTLAAQTATFTFGAIENQFNPYVPNRCTPVTSWNGVAATDPSNPFPQNMGQICLNIYPNPFTSITIPWQLGFPNNGYLQNCQPTVWTPTPTNPYIPSPVDNGDGTGTNSFTVSGCYVAQNTTITAMVNYEKITLYSCSRGRCTKYTAWQVIGGSGTVVNE